MAVFFCENPLLWFCCGWLVAPRAVLVCVCVCVCVYVYVCVGMDAAILWNPSQRKMGWCHHCAWRSLSCFLLVRHVPRLRHLLRDHTHTHTHTAYHTTHRHRYTQTNTHTLTPRYYVLGPHRSEHFRIKQTHATPSNTGTNVLPHTYKESIYIYAFSSFLFNMTPKKSGTWISPFEFQQPELCSIRISEARFFVYI